MSRLCVWIAVSWLALCLPVAHAQDWQLVKRSCAGIGENNPDARIAACDVLINESDFLITEGKLSRDELPKSFYNRGLAYNLKGLHGRAIDDYGLALRHDPYHLDALNNRGASYYEMGQYDRALEDFDRALRIDPNDPRARANRCEALTKLGRQDARCRRAPGRGSTAAPVYVGYRSENAGLDPGGLQCAGNPARICGGNSAISVFRVRQ